MGFKIASSGDFQKLASFAHQQFWYLFGWFFGTQKGYRNQWFSKMTSSGDFQNSQFWCTSNFGARLGVSECSNLFKCISSTRALKCTDTTDTLSTNEEGSNTLAFLERVSRHARVRFKNTHARPSVGNGQNTVRCEIATYLTQNVLVGICNCVSNLMIH